MNKKILLASGCSFTGELQCWPFRLSEKLNIDLLNVGMLSQGNGLISRKVIYNVEKLLKNYNSEDILVGIMWSGVDRYDYYTHSSESTSIWGFNADESKNVKIPTNIVENNYRWQILNAHWNSDKVRMYYEHFHTNIFSMIQTIEHILRIQWYLDKLNIKYFMSTYTNIFDKNLINHVEIKYLYDQIDFTKFLPIEGCYEWVLEKYPNEFVDLFHPSKFGHDEFSNHVIIPFLKNNEII